MRVFLTLELKQMSLLNTEILPFKAQAYANDDFVELTEDSLKGHWSVVFFYPSLVPDPTDCLP